MTSISSGFSIEALRTFMNPETGQSLERLLARIPSDLESRPLRTSPPVDRRARYGLIEETCLQVLEDSAQPMTIGDVHSEVESRLATKVSRSSVKNALRRLASPSKGALNHVAGGLYRRNPPGQCLAD